MNQVQSRVLKAAFHSLAPVVLAFAPAALLAQAHPSGRGPADYSPSRWDVFGGYSYLSPRATVNTLNPSDQPISVTYDPVNAGAIGSFSYFFNRTLGLQGEVGVHEFGNKSNTGNNPGTEGNNDGFTTFAGGLIARFPMGRFTPFLHALGGAALVGGPIHEPNKLGPDVTGGGGLDLEMPWFNNGMAIRLVQADYEFMHENWGTGVWEGAADINALRLSAGVVLHSGPIAPPPAITLACSANPETIYPGDPVTVTATAGGLNPKYNAIYGWSGTGVTGSGTTASVATESLAAGEYNVEGTVKEGKRGKEGAKPWENATCTAGLTVKAFEPPTISCSVNPTTIKPGDTATVSCVAVSPQNRPLTYNYAASAGTVTGTGSTAAYSSAGAPTGTVGITASVADDKGHNATAQTSLTVAAPYVPPPPKSQALCTLSFTLDKKRPVRVDNTAKACLDQVALDLKQQADAKAVLVGEETPDETAKEAKEQAAATAYADRHKHAHKLPTVEVFAAQRAVNAKDYLVTEQGIDASRISVVTGSSPGQTVEDYLVPVGATFTNDVSGTTPVDESEVKPQVRKPLPEKHGKGE